MTEPQKLTPGHLVSIRKDHDNGYKLPEAVGFLLAHIAALEQERDAADMSDDPMERIARERYQEWLTHPHQYSGNPTWDELDVNTRNDWREDAVDILPRLRSGDRVGPDGSLVVVPAEAAEARVQVLEEALTAAEMSLIVGRPDLAQQVISAALSPAATEDAKP